MSCAICLSACPNGAARIVRAVVRLVPRRVRALQHLDRVERLAAGAVRARGRRAAAYCDFERRARRSRLARADAELRDLVHGDRRRRALQHARQLRRERDGAERASPARVCRACR